MPNHPHKILVVEDDPSITELVKFNLEEEGFAVTTAARGDDGLKAALSGAYSLLILDVGVPVLSGFEICKRVQASQSRPHILLLTSRSQEVDRVLGFELGADDYVTKPFSVRELVARVKAFFRRKEEAKERALSATVKLGSVEIDPQKRIATKGGDPIELTPLEFDLLLYFASHRGKAFSREMLLSAVWGYSYAGYEHTVNSHINRLRNKIEDDPAKPQFIQTVWGVGYRCADA